MAIDVSIRSYYVNDEFYSSPTGKTYVLGGMSGNAGGPITVDLTPYATFTYVDGSLAIRDASISFNLITNNIQDVSISELDASMVRIYGGDVSLGGIKEFLQQPISNLGIKSNNFYSGFTGSGFNLEKQTDGDYRLEVDDLFVRGSMTVWEYIIYKIKASNGSLWISSSNKASSGLFYDYKAIDPPGSAPIGRWYFVIDGSNEFDNCFWENDLIKAQARYGNGISIYEEQFQVQDTSGTRVNVYFTPTYDASTQVNDVSISNGNVNTFSYDAGGGYYNCVTTTTGSYCLTDFFNVKAGLFKIFNKVQGFVGLMTCNLLDASNDTYATLFRLTAPGIYDFDGSALIGADASLRIRYSFGPSADVSIYKPDYVNYEFDYDEIPDVTGMEFVRIGNTTNQNRMGSIYLSADDVNSPKIVVLDDVSSWNYGTNEIKAILGNIDGNTWNGQSITGYGLFSQNSYLTGGINANYGNIGNFEINNGKLIGSGSAGDQIVLDPALPSLVISDASSSIVAEFTNQSILSVNSIISSTEIEYAGNYADDYTNVKRQMTTTGALNCPSIYIMNHQTNANTYLDASTSKRASTYNIQTNAGTRYNFNLYIDVCVNYSLPTSDDHLADYSPTYSGSTEYETAYINIYSTTGSYSVNASTYIYDGSSNAKLASSNSATISGLTSSYLNWHNVVNLPFTAGCTSTYVILKPNVNSTIEGYCRQYTWVWDPDFHIPIHTGTNPWWNPGSNYISFDISTYWNFTVNEMELNGRIQKTQIGQDGILTYWNENGYFTINNVAYPLLQSAGDWTHKTSAAQTMHWVNNGANASGSGAAYYFSAKKQGYVAIFENNNNAIDYYGLLIKAGHGTNGGTLINFQDANGENVGSITHNGTNTAYNTSSDKRLKEDIKDSELDALELIDNLKVRDFTWKKNNKKDTGFIAQEVLETFPKMVSVPFDEEEMMGIDNSKLVPILVKAIQELKSEVNDLKSKLEMHSK